ncbi:TPA: RelA/SpoT domain-containing protein [Aeromonas dhakensis]|nr:RelA/SpoT domain-containing protein [Aeromonas dhakensis]
MSQHVSDAVSLYIENKHLVERFMQNVLASFSLEPALNSAPFPLIHTIKYRLKDPIHLADKLHRMGDKFKDKNELFTQVNDLAGIRILHLYQDDFPLIHRHIMNMVENDEWRLLEQPVAYSWDPELNAFFQELSLDVRIKDSHYTSIHYVVAPPNSKTNVSCEIQVRTLFEEIWGEIDHSINYPYPTKNMPVKEQIRVLSKLVSTGSRLATSIYRSNTPQVE